MRPKAISAMLRSGFLAGLLVMAFGIRASAQQAAYSDSVQTMNGIVLLGYADNTDVKLLKYGQMPAWSGTIGNVNVTNIKLTPGFYTLQASDEVKVVSID